MAVIVPILFGLVLPVVLALVLAWVLARLCPQWSLLQRSLLAGFGAGFIPWSLPLAVMAIGPQNEFSDTGFILALVVAVITSLAIGLPAALFARRGKEPSGPPPDAFD